MKKVLLAYGVLVVVVVLLAFAKFNGFTFIPGFGEKTATINNRTYKLLIADNDKSLQIGLSNRDSLDKDTGMYFIFPKKDRYTFWMKDTKIPLDIIFINDNKIVSIAKNAPPQAGKKPPYPLYTAPSNVDRVLEVNAGESDKNNFKTGDTVTLKGVK